MMQVPQIAIDLIAEFEGFRAHAYLCPAGVWTVGYGTTSINGRPVDRTDVLTEPEAMRRLRFDVDQFAKKIGPALKVEPTHTQFAAMLSLAYNIGPVAFRRSSVLRRFNQGDIDGAAEAFLMWNKATVNGRKVVMRGLALRRERERSIFLGLLQSADLV